jgi:glucose-6-phosphate isomerase
MLKIQSNFFSSELCDRSKNFEDKAVSSLRDLQKRAGIHRDMTGWFNYPKNSGGRTLADIQKFQHEYHQFFDTVVVVGIGGSYLGARSAFEALSHRFTLGGVGHRKPMIFLGNHLSEQMSVETLEFLKERDPVVVVISKSGTTTEPAVAFRLVKKFLEAKYGKQGSSARIVAITDDDRGGLRQQVTQNDYPSFVIPGDVGGRYSVLTPVGMLPLALCGINTTKIMDGAAALFDEIMQGSDDELRNHPAIQYACLRMAAYEEGKRAELLVYGEPKLKSFAEWWRQLFGESQGKEGKGFYPGDLVITTDLHSVGQFVQEGSRIAFETFLSFDDPRYNSSAIEQRLAVPKADDNLDDLGYLEGAYIADINRKVMESTMAAHADGGVPNINIVVPKIDEFCLGYLYAFFQVACAVGGDLLGVNPYDQPGVEEYKKNLFALLGKPGYEERARRLKQLFPST